MRWVIDEQLSPRLVAWLAEKGQEAIHVRDALAPGTVDGKIWDYAVKEQTIILSKDEDFPDRHAVASVKPRVVWIRFGNCSHAEFVRKFGSLFPAIVSDLEAGADLIEVADPDR